MGCSCQYAFQIPEGERGEMMTGRWKACRPIQKEEKKKGKKEGKIEHCVNCNNWEQDIFERKRRKTLTVWNDMLECQGGGTPPLLLGPSGGSREGRATKAKKKTRS